MTTVPEPVLAATDLDALASMTGRIAVLVASEGTLGASARKLDRLTKGALRRLASSAAFDKLKPGEALDLTFPSGMTAEAAGKRKGDRREADGHRQGHNTGRGRR